MNTITHTRTDVDDQPMTIGTVTGERLVPLSQGYTYVLDVTLGVPLLYTKVRATVKQDAYAFQTSAKVEVLDKVGLVWNTLAVREGQLIHDLMPSYVSRNDVAKRDAAHEIASSLVREVFDLLA